ncbi:hypothetical protein [Actinomadura sp. 9N215]|uniref:hypothetical protein n=1 Tax=Actinomadura sp. 9N215 TaxID=3375150 RepID=UPI0037B57BC9
MTAYRYRQPLASQDEPSRPGYEFAGLDAGVCLKKTPDGAPAGISIDPWSLAYADDTRVEPATTVAESFSVPLYPQLDKSVGVGDCVRGWVVFEVAKGKRPVRTTYTPTNTDTPARSLQWVIG